MENKEMGINLELHVAGVEAAKLTCKNCGHEEGAAEIGDHDIGIVESVEIEDEPCPHCGGIIFDVLAKFDIDMK